MWFATKKGLFRYNGYEMINYSYDPLDANSIPSDALETITIDTAGNIWLGSLGAGVFKFDPVHQKFTQYRHSQKEPNSLSADWVSVVKCDKQGNIWIGAGNGLDRFDPQTNSFIHYTSKKDDPATLSANEVVAIYQDRKGTLWIGTGSVYGPLAGNPEIGGLNRMDDISGKFTRYTHSETDTATLISNKVRSIYESSDGTFWVGTAGDGLHTLDRKTGKFHRLTNNPHGSLNLSRPPVTSNPFSMVSFITEDAKGGIWIGTDDNGVNYYDPATKKIVHVLPGSENANDVDNFMWTAFTSAEGMLWMSSVSGALYTYNPLQIKVPFKYVGVDEVTGVYEDNDNWLWVSTIDKGLLHFNKEGRLIESFTHDDHNPNSLNSDKLLSLIPGRSNDLWIGTLGAGLEQFSLKTRKVTHYPANPQNERGLVNDTVVRLYQDQKGKLWTGTFRGLSSLNDNSTFNRYLMYPADTAQFGRNIVTSVLQNNTNKYWVGSFVGGGIHLLDPEKDILKTYLQSVSVTGVMKDSRGTLWVGAIEGLFYYDNAIDSFLRYNDPTGLIQIGNVLSMVEDDDQNIWLASSNNLKRISAKRDFVTLYDNHFANDNSPTFSVAHKGRSGKLYFPAEGGFYEIYPPEFNSESKPPQIVISNFRLMNQSILPGPKSILNKDISVTSQITLKYNQNVFSFDFAAIDFVDPSANKLLFMLENYDWSWNSPGSDRKAVYFYVPPGRYVFRVRAVNAYGKWAEKSITIEIIPAWWSSWWFRVTVTIAVIGLIYFLIRWRLNVKFRLGMERSEKEKELSRLQHRTAQLEMHALRAQMNPHFLFNSLNSINRFIIQNNSEQASEYLTKFSRLMRLILQNSQHELIPLENELEALKLYLELEAVRFDHHFSYAIKIDEHLDVAVLKVPPLIIQPYAENAIWHGLMHKEEKGNLLIELKEEEGGYLVCSITDDGIGRKKAAELKSKSASTHKSMGMKITADRIASMRQRKSNENNIQITDLVAADGSAAGTRVEIKIALHYD